MYVCSSYRLRSLFVYQNIIITVCIPGPLSFACTLTSEAALYCTVCNSYNMDTRALAHLLHEGAKRPRAINELSARTSML